MLDAVTLESSRAPVVHVHRQRHGDGALRIRRPFAVVLVDVQIIGDDAKLLASHLENFVVVNRVHRCISATLGVHGKLLFALVKWRRQLGNFVTCAVLSACCRFHRNVDMSADFEMRGIDKRARNAVNVAAK